MRLIKKSGHEPGGASGRFRDDGHHPVDELRFRRLQDGDRDDENEEPGHFVPAASRLSSKPNWAVFALSRKTSAARVRSLIWIATDNEKKIGSFVIFKSPENDRFEILDPISSKNFTFDFFD